MGQVSLSRVTLSNNLDLGLFVTCYRRKTVLRYDGDLHNFSQGEGSRALVTPITVTRVGVETTK